MTNGAKMGRNIGAAIGMIVFLIFGVVPAFYFGGYGVVVTLSHLFGGSLEPTVIVRMLMVAGIVLGIFCVGAVSVVLGAVFGTVIGYITELFTAPIKTKEAAVVEIKNE